MKTAAYPIFVLEKDDYSFREVASPKDLNWYEWPDIVEGLYEGWDSFGRHFVLAWNFAMRTPEVILEEQPDVAAFKQAVTEYAERYGRLISKPRGYCDPDALKQKVDEIEKRIDPNHRDG